MARILTYTVFVGLLLCPAGIAIAGDPFDFGWKDDAEIRCYVVDSKSIVRADIHQHYVDANQSWGAIELKVTQTTKGHVNGEMIYVSHGVVASSPQFTWHCANGEWYDLRLQRDAELSKWCEMDVYDVAGGHQITTQESTATSVTPPAEQPPRQP
jgi:hypothetical protein